MLAVNYIFLILNSLMLGVNLGTGAYGWAAISAIGVLAGISNHFHLTNLNKKGNE